MRALATFGLHGNLEGDFSIELHGRVHSAGCSSATAAVLLHFLGQSNAIPSGVTCSEGGLEGSERSDGEGGDLGLTGGPETCWLTLSSERAHSLYTCHAHCQDLVHLGCQRNGKLMDCLAPHDTLDSFYSSSQVKTKLLHEACEKRHSRSQPNTLSPRIKAEIFLATVNLHSCSIGPLGIQQLCFRRPYDTLLPILVILHGLSKSGSRMHSGGCGCRSRTEEGAIALHGYLHGRRAVASAASHPEQSQEALKAVKHTGAAPLKEQMPKQMSRPHEDH
ncbi:hypothetical protein IHE44_0012462 [Lamprotornis superbus]|uniref:Uncharacterized protein n=1 Tax=Lamprotornis superbus TaxID=245042 RepID=A0A835NQN0_9PASS|nr:hypothetical protein IHE44_0012462 [Lamprotornis superbus]